MLMDDYRRILMIADYLEMSEVSPSQALIYTTPDSLWNCLAEDPRGPYAGFQLWPIGMITSNHE